MKINIAIIILLITIILASCTPTSKAVPTLTKVLASTKTQTPRTPTASPTSFITTTPKFTATPQPVYLDFEGIQSGQYLLVLGHETANYLYVVSKDNQIVRKLALSSSLYIDSDSGYKILNASFDVSSDGTQFLIMRPSPKQSYVLNLITGTWMELDIKQECVKASWSPDKQLIALSCLKDDSAEISIFDTMSGVSTQVTNCSENYKFCWQAAWSIDGHWLAYYQGDIRSGEHPREIMIFHTNCLSRGDCTNQQMGLIKAASEPNWSPKNQLVFISSGMISYFELKNRSLNQLSSYLLPNVPLDGALDFFRLSPDGDYVAYVPFGVRGIYLYSRLSGKSKLLLENQYGLDPIGWLTIP